MSTFIRGAHKHNTCNPLRARRCPVCGVMKRYGAGQRMCPDCRQTLQAPVIGRGLMSKERWDRLVSQARKNEDRWAKIWVPSEWEMDG